MRRTLYCLVVSLALLQVAFAQEEATRPLFEVGIFPAAIVTVPTGSIETIRGSAPCSGEYSGSTRVNFGGTGWLSMPIWPVALEPSYPRLHSIRLSIGLEDLGSDFESPTHAYPAYDDGLGRYTEVETRFRAGFDLLTLMSYLEIEGELARSLLLRFGLSLGVPLNPESRQEELIISPATATFADGRQERILPEGTGSLDDVSNRIGISAGVAYRMPLGRSLFFEPAITADYGIANIQPAWSPLLMRLGIGIGISLLESEPEPIAAEPEPAADPVVITPPPPVPFAGTVEIARVGGNEPVALRRHVVARYVPVIPVIFFPRGDATLAAPYRSRGPASFKESDVPAAADAAHELVLEVLGSRLRSSAGTSVTVVGATSEDEGSRESLARMRAESVATYLREVWGISPSRVGVRWQVSPSVPTNSAWPEGLEENRRVEIEVSDPSLLDPVMLRSVEPVTQPESIAFRPSVTASRAITSWRLELDDPFGRLSDVSGTGAPPPEIEWRLTQEDRERILSTGSVGFQFSVQDAAGALLVSSRGEMPLRLDTTVTVASSAGRPATTAEFLLITFEFDQARLNLRGRRELETIVSRIGPESTVEVVGYTDRLGDAAHNLALASERARAVASQLPSGTPVISRGAPADEAPYDNSLPQGRFLNRTVRVVVNNPR